MMPQPATYYDEGMRFYEAQEYEQAIEMFTRALRLSLGDLAEIALYRGICYAYLQAYDRAYEDFSEALRRNPHLADAYNERGNLLRLKEQYTAAVEDYTAALHLEPQHYAALYNRALAYEKLGQFTEAERDLDRALEIAPALVQAYEVRGRIRALRKDYAGAIADLRQYLQMGGGHEFDNQSEIQSFVITLRLNRLLSQFIPARFLPSSRM